MSEAIRQFEEEFARFVGVRSAFAFWKGRVALYAILKALGISEGDEVILPGYTCVAVPNPVKYVGAKPVYGDIEPNTYCMPAEEIQRKITPRTRLIVAQHSYGYPAEMDAVMDVANRHGLPVVEDCCLALGSRYRGRLCGTFGLAAYWSFQWNKPFTTGLGGMVVTGDRELAQRIRGLCTESLLPPPLRSAAILTLQRLAYRMLVFPRTTAILTRIFRYLTHKGLILGSFSTREFIPQMEEGFLQGMSVSQARAGLAQLRRFNQNIVHRRQIADLYNQLLKERGWPVTQVPSCMDPVLVRYPVRVADKVQAIALASKRMVELGTWFESPLHDLPSSAWAGYGYKLGMCPVAEKAAREVVNLPLHRRVSKKAAQQAVKLVFEIGRPEQ